MVDFSKWRTRFVSVNRLRLDPDNPRLATSIRRPTQKELIADLLEHEQVMDLVRDIARQGFFPSETLVAIQDGSSMIVIEGNRRLAALKLLLNPELAPANYQNRIRQHADRTHKPPEKVQIALAPSRSAAVPLIIARHNGEAVKAWTPIMQARFVQSRMNSGLAIQDIAEETGLERAEIVRQLRDAKLYDVIRSMPLAPPAQEIVNDPRKFPFTTLRRLIEYSSVQQLLDIKTDEEHGFVTRLSPEDFQRLLTRIVTDIAVGNVTSRSHNTSAEVDRYIKELKQTLGKPREIRKSAPTPADEFVDPSRVQPLPAKPRRTTAKKQTAPVALIPKGFRVDIDDQRIRDVAEELRTLKVAQFPNCVAITFRSLLEMSVTKYLHDNGELKKLTAKLSAKKSRRADWVPTLNQQLCHILETDTIPLKPEGRKALQKFVSDAKQPLTLDSLNWFTHNRYVPPTVDQLRAFWTNLTPLFELTLQTPEQEPKR